MLPISTLPASLLSVLQMTRWCFTEPSFVTFCQLIAGSIAAPGQRTVTGMWTGAGLAGVRSHHRAHQFFSRASWDPYHVGLVLARAVVACLLPEGAPVEAAVDDTLFRRRGKKVHQAFWAHDGSGRGKDKLGYGNTWVVTAVIVQLPFLPRPIALPVLALLWRGKGTASRTALALRMVTDLAELFHDRQVHGVGDAAYHSPETADLPANATFTFRLPRNAALSEPAPPRTGRRGRPRKQGTRLGNPGEIAADQAVTWTKTLVRRYGRTETVYLAVVTCQWYGTLKDLPVRLVLLRDRDTATGYDLAILTTDLTATPAELIARYAARWGIEVIFQHGRADLGIGQTRTRNAHAVERAVPFGLFTYTITVLWYTLHGHHPADLDARREAQPWYITKTDPALTDMIAKLRRVMIAARNIPKHAGQPTKAEILAVTHAWAAASA